MARPLDGIRVLEIGQYIAGPFCGMLLADMGADVIKIERPAGDPARIFLPTINGESVSFAASNRNKRSIALDLKRPEAREIVLRLAAKSDVLLENNRPGALEKLGLGAKEVREVNPSVVYVSVSGYGQSGPYQRRAGVNFIVEAFSGSLSITGDPDDMPMRPGIQTADICGALFATYAVLSGLMNVARNKQGGTFDVALVDASIAAAIWETSEYLTTGRVPKRLGHRHRVTTPSQLFKTRDGRYLAISAASNDLFKRLLTALDLSNYIDDVRFTSLERRMENEDALLEILVPCVRRWNSAELEVRLVALGLACSQVNDYAQVFADPHIRARGVAVEVTHPRLGQTKTVRNPVLMDSDGPEITCAAPLLGQHSIEILRELGYTDERIAEMARSSIVKLGSDRDETDTQKGDDPVEGGTSCAGVNTAITPDV